MYSLGTFQIVASVLGSRARESVCKPCKSGISILYSLWFPGHGKADVLGSHLSAVGPKGYGA